VIGQPEGRYGRPTGIAIDRAAGRLYVADTLKNEIVVTDLQGHDILRFGRSGEGAGEFNAPTQLCLSAGRVYVTDALNARVQFFGLDGKYLGGFGRLGRNAGDSTNPKAWPWTAKDISTWWRACTTWCRFWMPAGTY
jgi:DNA-binding beta-propeller fold protein YncE